MSRYDKLKRASKSVKNTNTQQSDEGGETRFANYVDLSSAPNRDQYGKKKLKNGVTAYKEYNVKSHKSGDGRDIKKHLPGSTYNGGQPRETYDSEAVPSQNARYKGSQIERKKKKGN